jgi:hypothetical protein
MADVFAGFGGDLIHVIGHSGDKIGVLQAFKNEAGEGFAKANHGPA